MLPDTLGVLSPDEVFSSLSDMIERFPWATLDFHPHNDYGLGSGQCTIMQSRLVLETSTVQ